MACIYGSSIAATLDQELSSLQKELQDVEVNLKKLTGQGISSRDHDSKRNRRTESSGGHDRRRRYEHSRSPVEPIDEEPPRKLQSSVVATSRLKPREHALEEQKSDEKSLARNRRMFGMILGTLQKFQSDESRRRPTQREAIEQKVEKEAEEEAANVKKERVELFKARRQKQAEIRRIQLKKERVAIHEEWEKSHLLMGSFIQTRTKPCIFYVPKKFCEETEKRRKDTKDKYRMIIAEKRARIQKELNEIDELYTKKEGHDENVEDESNDDGAIESRESLRANQAPEEHPILNEKDVQNEEMEEEKGDTVNETTEFEPIYDE